MLKGGNGCGNYMCIYMSFLCNNCLFVQIILAVTSLGKGNKYCLIKKEAASFPYFLEKEASKLIIIIIIITLLVAKKLNTGYVM